MHLSAKHSIILSTKVSIRPMKLFHSPNEDPATHLLE